MHPKPPNPLVRNLFLGGFVLMAGGTLISALAPPTSSSALSTSLAWAKTVSMHGSIVEPLPSTTAAPCFSAMIYAWALTLDGPVAATLVCWLFGLLLAAGTMLLAQQLVDRAWGWCAGALTLLSPGIAYQMSAPLEDLPMAAFAALALAAWWRGAVELLSPRWFILAGLFLGAALATKACAVALLVGATIAWTFQTVRYGEHRQEVAFGAMQSVLIAIVIAMPGWIWTLTSGGALAPTEQGAALVIEIGPWFLAILPGLLLVRRLRGLQLMGMLTVGIVVSGWLITPQSRCFSLWVPLLATMSTWICMEISRLPQLVRRVSVGSLTAISAILIVANLASTADRCRVAFGLQTREAYLHARVGPFAASQIANRIFSSGARMLSEDPCGLYFNCSVASEPYCPSSAIASESGSMLQQLRSQGFSHLLLCSQEDDEESLPVKSSRIHHAVRDELMKTRSETVLPLTEYRFTDAAGSTRHYQLLMLRR